MSSVKSKGNLSTEVSFCNALLRKGILGWRRHEKIYGNPDIYFPWYKIVVFLDGCFWHGCNLCKRTSKSNIEYWENKIQTNIARDGICNDYLLSQGYHVVRFWEHEIKNSINSCIESLDELIHACLDKVD